MIASTEVKKVTVVIPPMPVKINDRIRFVHAIMAPHEVDGWKGTFYHYVSKHTKKLADGSVEAEVSMIRQLDENGVPIPSEIDDTYLNWDWAQCPEKTWAGPNIGRE